MPRALDPAVITALASDAFVMADLVELFFTSPVRFSSAGFDIEYGGNTYTANEHLQKIGTISQTVDVRVGTITITLGGADQTWFSVFLTQNYIGVPVTLSKAILDNAGNVIGEPILFFSGTISGAQFDESDRDSSVEVSCSSQWANFSAINGRKTNDTDQQRLFPGDLGMEFAPKTINDIPWGSG